MSLLIHPKRGPEGSDINTVHYVAYHRNGIGGEGFYAVEFTTGRGKQAEILHAIVTFDENGPRTEAYVTMPSDPSRAFRGTDHWAKALRMICEQSKWPHEVEAAK